MLSQSDHIYIGLCYRGIYLFCHGCTCMTLHIWKNLSNVIIIKIYFFSFRDNGISISISIIQWAIEIINQVIYYCYIFILHGKSNFMDKLFGLYLISFTSIIQPAFYLSGDYEFRRNLATKGPIKALRIALFHPK